MAQSVIQRSFAGGEISESVGARADIGKYVSGARTLKNFLVRREGGAANRPGLRYVATSRSPTAFSSRLMRYASEVLNESILIEAGEGYFRFFRAGAPVTVTGVPAWSATTNYVVGDLVVVAGVNYYCIAANLNTTPPDVTFWYAMPAGDLYEIPSPYTALTLPDFNQSGRIITLTHRSHQPRELIFESRTRWILRAATTAPSISAPVGWTATRGGAGARNYRYVVTAAAIDTYEESLPTAPIDCLACLEPTPGAPNVIQGPDVLGAAEYYIYCDPYENGTYGFIGTATLSSPTSDYFGAVIADGATGYWRLGEEPINPGDVFADSSAGAHHMDGQSGLGFVSVPGGLVGDSNHGIQLPIGGLPWPFNAHGTPSLAAPLSVFSVGGGLVGSVEFLVRPNADTIATDPAFHVVLAKPVGLTFAIGLRMNAGNLRLSARWNDGGILFGENATPLVAGTLYHVVLTVGPVGANNATWYVNGVADGTFTIAATAPAFDAFTLFNEDGGTLPFYGDLVDDVAVYGGVLLSVIQVADHYAKTLGGTATQKVFHDVGFVPDFSVTPPVARNLFSAGGQYPTTSAFYQQRRFFANSDAEPDRVDGSRTGFPGNFGISSPLQDDDAIQFRLAGNNNHPVRHLVGTKNGLVLGTDGGEWTATGGGGPKTPITPSSIDTEQETYVGFAPDVRPVIVGNSIIYVQARGSIVRELKFQQENEGFNGRDLTIFAAHLVDGYAIRRLDFQQTPHSITWAVRDDGILLGLTYVPEQDIWGWHRHETQQNATPAVVEDVCVIPENDEDGVYVLVRRIIGGATVRYHERLASRNLRVFDEDVFFVDSGLSYSGTPVSNVAGLDHLNGQIVAVVADGAVLFDGNPIGAGAANFRVAGGTLPVALVGGPYSNIHVGLAIRYPDLETLDLDVQGTDLRDKKKRVGSITILVDRSSRSFWAGPDAAHLVQYATQSFEAIGDEHTGQLELNLVSTFSPYGRVLIRQTDPLPLTILGVIPSLEAGG